MRQKPIIAYLLKNNPKRPDTFILNEIPGLEKLVQADLRARTPRSAERCGFECSNWGVAANLRMLAPMKTSQVLT